MKQAIIDIGSNSMRLTVYEVGNQGFKLLFREKNMAGLAGYVENGALSKDGIVCAYNGLLDFKETVNLLDIASVNVFATASLRNISNTPQALGEIKAATGYEVEVISGEEEALYGYMGAMMEQSQRLGSYIDIGGASTEIAVFSEQGLHSAISFPLGSLSLYRECVKKILPGAGSLKRIRQSILSEIDEKKLFHFDKQSPMLCVGGTARAVLKIAKKVYEMPDQRNTMTALQLKEVCTLLCRADQRALELILRHAPDRIHTIVPGVMILEHISALFEAEEIIVSKFGVREGYLCKKILQLGQSNTHLHKTEN